MARNGVDPEDLGRYKKNTRSFVQALTKESFRALRDQKNQWLSDMAGQFRAPLVPYGQKNANRRLHNRTNSLRNSLKGKVFGNTLKNAGIRYSSSSPYVLTQEFGAVIRPRNAKRLAIPIDDNLFPAGSRKTASPREHPNGRFLNGKRTGNSYFVDGLADDTKFLFALRDKVVIPGPKSDGTPSRLKFTEHAIGTEARKAFRRRLVTATNRALESYRG